jgi:hypothetical protein
MAWGWMITLRGAVEGAAPTAAGPRGRARWRKESGFAMLGGEVVNASIRLSVKAAPGLPRLYNRGKDWVKLHGVSVLRRRSRLRAKISCAGGQNFALVG